MTLAVAKALLSTRGQNDAAIKAALVHEMQQLGRAYPDRGYGTHWGGWLYDVKLIRHASSALRKMRDGK